MKLKCASTVVVVIITAIVTAVIAGAIVYLWQQNICLKNTATTSETTPTTTTTPTPIAQTTIDMTSTGTSPSDVTESFILSTLGTVPGAQINYEKAKKYISADLLAQWTDDSFIPTFYGIQDGPEAYEIKTQSISGDTASVKVDVTYGEMMTGWAFMLVKENGAWKIDEFRNDAQ